MYLYEMFVFKNFVYGLLNFILGGFFWIQVKEYKEKFMKY